MLQVVHLLLHSLELHHVGLVLAHVLHLLAVGVHQVVCQRQVVGNLGEAGLLAPEVVAEAVVPRLELHKLHLQVRRLGVDQRALLLQPALHVLPQGLPALLDLAELADDPVDGALHAVDGAVLALELVAEGVELLPHGRHGLRGVGLELPPLVVPAAELLLEALDHRHLLVHAAAHLLQRRDGLGGLGRLGLEVALAVLQQGHLAERRLYQLHAELPDAHLELCKLHFPLRLGGCRGPYGRRRRCPRGR
mmetsp:Transcript_45641/g.145670  ORF Transcript_45641/g.145670 Transcript_45641/m.145670 type:complete len:249 (-) Transcript_45641:88-834(-)